MTVDGPPRSPAPRRMEEFKMSGSPWKTLIAGTALGALLLAGNAAAGDIPGVSSMKEAMELSVARKVPIVVDFSTDW